jgi:hypothetical protein
MLRCEAAPTLVPATATTAHFFDCHAGGIFLLRRELTDLASFTDLDDSTKIRGKWTQEEVSSSHTSQLLTELRTISSETLSCNTEAKIGRRSPRASVADQMCSVCIGGRKC